MDFGALPPEINSGRMYAGPGAGPMMAAGSAWNALGAELADTAAAYESVISALTGEEWRGPSSAAMANAAAPYVAWMNATAGALQHAASQAMASAAAYEAAWGMTVPPPVIAANRAQLATLVATNLLGQNTPAIAATDAHYGQMWAQDAAAMYGYAGSSAAAAKLSPLASPMQTTNPAGPAGQAAGAATGGTQAGLSQLISGMPGTVQGLSSPLAGSGGFLSNAINSTQNIGIFNAIQTYGTYAVTAGAWQAFAGAASAIAIASPGVSAAGAGGLAAPALVDATAPAGAAGPAGASGAGATTVSAGLRQASTVGGMSVPNTWSEAVPATETASASSAGTGWTAATDEPMPMETVPAGAPGMASAGRGGSGFGGPRYGVRPTVMARPVVAG